MLQNKRNKNLALIGGIGASIVMAIMGISVYYGVNPGIKGLFAAIVIFSVLEILVILAAITLFNPYAKGVLRSFATLVLVGCISMEIFVTANEMQGGVLKKMESAKAAETTSSNAATANSAMVQAQRGIADCNARFPRPKNDRAARESCSEPFNAALKSAQGSQGEIVAFSADNAAERSKWQAIADWYNADKLADEKITPDQAAFFVFMFLGILISFGKVFLYAIYGSEGSSSNEHPTPLPPTGTDDNHSKDSGYRTSKVGFNSPAPLPTASNKGTVSNSSANTKYSSRTVYPAQNTVRVERSGTNHSAPRATSVAPVVTMGTTSSAQAKAAQRWHLTDGNAALDTSTVLETPTVLAPSTVPEQFDLSKNTAEWGLNTEKYSNFYAAYDEALRTGVVGRATVRPTKQWLAEQLKQSDVQLNTVERDSCVNWLLAEAERRGRIRPVFGRDDKHPQGRCEVVK